MKKVFKLFITSLSLFTLVSCQQYYLDKPEDTNLKYLDKPEDTNLKYWITERVDSTMFKEDHFVPGLFGGDMYLDGRYDAEYDEDGFIILPEKYVIYTVTCYPDYSSSETAITRIEITDPEIYFYGLTIKSSKEERDEVFTSLGFEIENEIDYYKNNCTFAFRENEVLIYSVVTNKHNIVF